MSDTFWYLRFIFKVLLIVQKSSILNSKPFLETRKPNTFYFDVRSEFNSLGEIKLNIGKCQSYHNFWPFLDYQKSDAKTKIHPFSFEQFSWSTDVLFDLLMEKSKLVVVENYMFENFEVKIDVILAIWPLLNWKQKKQMGSMGWVPNSFQKIPKMRTNRTIKLKRIPWCFTVLTLV